MSQAIAPLSRQVETSNGILHYTEYGSSNTETIFLLHGIPGSSHCWESLANMLGSLYRVIVPDMLGFGQSSKPKADYYIRGQAIAYAELYSKVTSDSIAVFGHDFGGPVAVTLLKDFKEVKIDKLVLASTNLFIDTYIPPPMRLAKVPIIRDALFWIMTGNGMGMRMLYKRAVRNKETYTFDQYKKSISESSMRYTSRIFKKSLSNLELHYQSIQDYLPKVTIPVLVLWGDSDPFFAVDVAERTNKAFPNSRLSIYNRTGHFVPSEQPELVFDDLRKFMATSSSGSV